MYVVHAIIKVKTGHEEVAQSVFREPFKPAISAQRKPCSVARNSSAKRKRREHD